MVSTSKHSASGIIKTILLLIMLLTIGFGAYTYWQHRNSRPVALPKTLNISIGSNSLRVSEIYIRDPEQRVSGVTSRLDIAVTWPEFKPLAANTPLFAIGSQAPIIFIALEAADTTQDPALRPSNLYSRFLTTDITEGPGQLVSRIFKATSPYAGEVLHLAPPNGEVFAARCIAIKALETRPEHCLWLLRVEGLDIQVRFSESLLVDWETLSELTRQLLEQIRVKKG